MITDKDINKLKTVFATKVDLKTFSTKEYIVEMRKDFSEKFHIVIKMLADMNDKLDIFLLEVKDNKDSLNNHERRLDRLENQVFPN